MKSKVEEEIEDDSMEMEDEDVEIDSDDDVDAGAPDVASSKGSKVTLIAFSAVLIAVVFYFLFFSGGGEDGGIDSLDPVTTQTDFVNESPAEAGDSDEFDSIFGEVGKGQDEGVVLETPDLPSVPQLPDIFGDEPDDNVLPSFLDLPKGEKPSALPPIGGVPELPGGFSDSRGNDQSGDHNQDGGNNSGGNNNSGGGSRNSSSIIVVSGGVGPVNSIGYENNIINLNKDPILDLKKSVSVVESKYISGRSTMIVQGKIITAILETAINTEFPGDVRGIVSRDVYAESGGAILIPKGSRLYGAYSSQVARGQARVSIGWTRLIRPDGVDASISFNASDQFGRSGIEGEVDNKYGSVITNSILTSVLAIGGAIAAEKLSDSGSTTTTSNPTDGVTSVTGGATTQAITDVTKTVMDTIGTVVGNTIDLTPIIRIPQGTKITIVVNQDISLPEFKK